MALIRWQDFVNAFITRHSSCSCVGAKRSINSYCSPVAQFPIVHHPMAFINVIVRYPRTNLFRLFHALGHRHELFELPFRSRMLGNQLIGVDAQSDLDDFVDVIVTRLCKPYNSTADVKTSRLIDRNPHNGIEGRFRAKSSSSDTSTSEPSDFSLLY